MKRNSWIVCSLAALFLGQIAAFGQTTTTAVYAVDATISYKVAKTTGSLPGSATATFLSDGTFSLIGSSSTNSLQFSGTYSVPKNGKSATIKSSADEIATMKSDIASIIEGDIQSEFPGATVTINSLRWSKLSLSGGVPVSASITGSGKGCEGKHCKSFTFKVTATFGACQLSTCSSL